MAKDANNKVSLDVKTWLMLMGMMVSTITMLSGIAMIVFKTQTSAASDHSTHEMKPAHAVQIEVNRVMKEINVAQQNKLDATYDNVLIIGERLRAKNLQRVED